MLALSIEKKVINKFFKVLENVSCGTLSFVSPSGEEIVFKGDNDGPNAEVIVYDWSFVKNLFMKGDVGFGEDYITKKWDSNNLLALLSFCTSNEDHIDSLVHGNIWSKIYFLVRNMINNNSKKGSKKNIKAHYDVGNDFYQLWLDKSMTYSSGIFAENNNLSIEDAQIAKYQRIIKKITASNNGNDILEIGCGWGGFVENASKNNLNVTAVTISQEQYNFTKKRVKNLKGADIQLLDYRDIQGSYDHIVSIEMFEAVGRKYWKQYFNKLKSLLKKNGSVILQIIVIDDEIFSSYLGRSDFIQQYIFPGGELPSKSSLIKLAKQSGFEVKEIHSFGQDYALTLKKWLDKFEAALDQILALGYNEEFIRSWRFYLNYCISGFLSKRTDVVQIEMMHEKA